MTLNFEDVVARGRDTVRVLSNFVQDPAPWGTSPDDALAGARVGAVVREALYARAPGVSMLTVFASVVRDDSVWQDAAPYQRQFVRSLLDAQMGLQVRFDTSQAASKRAAKQAAPVATATEAAEPAVWRNLAIV